MAAFEINPNFPGSVVPPGGFQFDGNFHTWDLSSVVPANVKAVACSLKVTSSPAGGVLRVRPYGDSGQANRCIGRTQVDGQQIHFYFLAEVSSDRKLDYQFSTEFSDCAWRIRGWLY